MEELIFEVKDAEEGGFHARALGKAIFTQGDTWAELKENILEAVDVYFDAPEQQPKIVQLHYVKNELMLVGSR
jgi:predicted RNase H-like HicB family nuclease